MFKISSTLVFTLLLIAPAACGGPTADPDPREILMKANAAAAALDTVSYEARFFGDGDFAERVPVFTGRVVARRGSTDLQHRVRIEGVTSNRSTTEEVAFKMVMDGKTVYSLDHKSKVFTTLNQAQGGTTAGQPLFQARYLHQNPYNPELDLANVVFEGTQDVGGVECNVIVARSGQNQKQSVRLFLGKEDYLLRRAEMVMGGTGKPGGTAAGGRYVFAVTGLDPKPDIDDDAFKLECPEGFTRRTFKPKTRTARSAPRSGLLPSGSEAPDWELKDGEGKTVSLKSLRGQVVVLDFWATWCGPCRRAMPALQRLHDNFKGKPVAVFGVNCRERTGGSDPMEFVRSKKFTYRQLLNGNAVASAYHVSGIPCLYVIGPDGKVSHAAAGFHPDLERQLTQIIESLLK